MHGQDADQAALQRFIALAERDEEDEWDSDEMLGDEQTLFRELRRLGDQEESLIRLS